MKNVFALLLIGAALAGSAQQLKLYPVEVKGKWGYMNNAGELVIAPQYDYADDFNEGFAVVALRNMPCVINEKNQRVVDTGMYQSIHPFSEGLSAVSDFKQHKFYLDATGKPVITLPDSIYEARAFHSGVAVLGWLYDKHETKFGADIATVGYRFAYISKTGQAVTPFIYEDADDMENGIARYRKGTLFGLIDSTGHEITDARYNLVDQFYEGKAVMSMKGPFGYINNKGETVIKPQFGMAYDFNEGMAGVMLKGKYGFIDANGNVVIEPQYEQIRAFSEGMAAVQLNGKWGFIDTKGNLVIGYNYDNASVFSEGLCAVLVKRKWGFINKGGRLVIPAEYDAAGSFENGVADIVYRDISVYINQSGTLLPKLK